MEHGLDIWSARLLVGKLDRRSVHNLDLPWV